MKDYKLLFFFCIFVVFSYFIYGFFYLSVPAVRPDELWEISRAHFLLKYHHQGDPLFPIEISPYLAWAFNATPGNNFLGLVKTASQAFFIALVPLDDIYAFRLTSFAWSLLVCFLTYKISLKVGLNNKLALLAVVLLIITPEFFSQLHIERPEIMITAAYLAGFLFFIYIIEMKSTWKKSFLLFLSGTYAWGAAITLHPNAIMIPATFGCIYILREYKNILSLNAFLFSISMLAGCLYFYYLTSAPSYKSLLEGGGNLLNTNGPPIFRRGIKVIVTLPFIFYSKLSAPNFLGRPFSFLFFFGSCISLYYLIRKKKKSPLYSYIDILIAGIVVSLIVLPLFSASNGRYNIIIFPLCAVLIAGAAYEYSFDLAEKSKIVLLFTCLLSILFLSNFIGFQQQNEYFKEFLNIRREIKNTITDSTATIIGQNLFYLDFKDQFYYSSSGLNPNIGRPSQSFEEAVKAVHTNYLIIDDMLIYRLYTWRGKTWTDSMFLFINRNCELIREIKTNYLITILPGSNKFPPQWRYKGQQKSLLKEIKIYRIVNS
jgi:hypothetical protein